MIRSNIFGNLSIILNSRQQSNQSDQIPHISLLCQIHCIQVNAHASNIKFEGEVNGVVTEAFGASSVDEDIVSLENFISIIQFDYFTTVRFVFGVTLPLKTILTVVK